MPPPDRPKEPLADRRRWLGRGITNENLTRIRELGTPAVGFEETYPVIVAMGVPYDQDGCTNGTEEQTERIEMAYSVLTAGLAPDLSEWVRENAQITANSPSEIQITLPVDPAECLSAELMKDPRYMLHGETDPRAIYILEPERVCTNEHIKEQQWLARFHGPNWELPGAMSIKHPEIAEVMGTEIMKALENEQDRIDPTTMKWVPPETPGALSAKRIWTMFERKKRGQKLTDVHHEAWTWTQDGVTKWSHDERNNPTEVTKRTEIAPGAIWQRGPSMMTRLVLKAVHEVAAALQLKHEVPVSVAAARLNWHADNAIKMATSLEAPRNVFGENDGQIMAVRVVTLPNSALRRPAALMAALAASGADPIGVAVTAKKMAGGSITVARVILMDQRNFDQPQNMIQPQGTMCPGARCSLWRKTDTHAPAMGRDFQYVGQDIQLAQENAVAVIDIAAAIAGFQQKMQEAATEGFAMANGEALREASKGLAEVIAETNVRQVEMQAEEARAQLGPKRAKFETDGYDDGFEGAAGEEKEVVRPRWESDQIQIYWCHFGEDMFVNFADMRKWAAKIGTDPSELKVVDLAIYAVHTGLIPTHLGYGNTALREAKPGQHKMMDPELVYDKKVLRRKQMEHSSLESLWKTLLNADNITMDFMELKDPSKQKSYSMVARPDSEDDDGTEGSSGDESDGCKRTCRQESSSS